MADDADLIKQALRDVLTADVKVTGKALEAKAAAAQQLARMNGLLPTAADGEPADDELGQDPMADLDELEAARRRRQRRAA